MTGLSPVEWMLCGFIGFLAMITLTCVAQMLAKWF